MPKSKMTEVRQDSSQQNESCRWIKNFVGVILAAVLLFVLFKELHSLSKDMDESRTLLKELSDRLAKTEKENENLRKELGRTKAKMENILQVFSNMQKVSRARRDHKPGHGSWHKCSKLQRCMERFNKGVNCTAIKKCVPSQRKGVNCTAIKKCVPSQRKGFFHVRVLEAFENRTGQHHEARLIWKYYSATMSTIAGNGNIIISSGGVYYLYCRLRVSKRIRKVIIRKNNSELFSEKPTFAGGNNSGFVHIFGLADIPGGTKLHVQVLFNTYTSLNVTPEQMSALFPDYFLEINSFGAFWVSSNEKLDSNGR